METEDTLNCKVFIGNIPYDITKQDLEEFFTKIGPIKDIK